MADGNASWRSTQLKKTDLFGAKVAKVTSHLSQILREVESLTVCKLPKIIDYWFSLETQGIGGRKLASMRACGCWCKRYCTKFIYLHHLWVVSSKSRWRGQTVLFPTQTDRIYNEKARETSSPMVWRTYLFIQKPLSTPHGLCCSVAAAALPRPPARRGVHIQQPTESFQRQHLRCILKTIKKQQQSSETSHYSHHSQWYHDLSSQNVFPRYFLNHPIPHHPIIRVQVSSLWVST